MGFSLISNWPRTNPLHQFPMNNTRTRCMTASAGTIIRRYSSPFWSFFLNGSNLYSMKPSSIFDVAGSHFRALTKILDCCLPTKFSSSFITNETVRSFNPAIYQRLVELLPLQLPNLSFAYSKPIWLFFYSKIQNANVLCFKSRTFYKVFLSRTPRFWWKLLSIPFWFAMSETHQ